MTLRNFLSNRVFWSTLLLTVFFALLIYYIANNWQEFATLRLTSPLHLVLLTLGVLISLYSNGALMDVVLRPLGLHLSRSETFGLAAITRLGNQIAPGNFGLAVRAGYLKRKHGFTLNKFASSLGAAHILMYLFSSMLGLIALLVVEGLTTKPDSVTFLAILGGFTALMLGLLLYSPHLNEGSNFITRHIPRAINGWNTIRRDRRTVRLAGFWALGLVLSTTIVTYAAFNALGGDISLLEAMFIMSLIILGRVVSITPAGLGVHEGIVVVAANFLGIPVAIALAAALLRRAVSLVVLLVVTPLFTRKLLNDSLWSMLRKS